MLPGVGAMTAFLASALKAQAWCADSETKMARLMRAIFSVGPGKVRTWLRGSTTTGHARTTAFSNVGPPEHVTRQRRPPVT